MMLCLRQPRCPDSCYLALLRTLDWHPETLTDQARHQVVLAHSPARCHNMRVRCSFTNVAPVEVA